MTPLASLALAVATLGQDLPKGPSIADLVARTPASATFVLALNLEPSARQKKIHDLIAPFLAKLQDQVKAPMTMLGGSASKVLGGLFGPDFKGLVMFAETDGKNPLAGNPLAALGSGKLGVMLPLAADGMKLDADLTKEEFKSGGAPKYWRGARYHDLGPIKVYLAKDAVVLSPSEKTFGEVKGGAGFGSLPGMADARARYDADANLVVLIKPSDSNKPWSGGALTAYDEGISLAVGPFSAGKLTGHVLSADYATNLPKGAYVVLGLGAPGEWMPAQKGGSGGIPPELTGALKGNVTGALYPSATMDGKRQGLELLLEMDGANGAEPASLLPKHLEELKKALGAKLAMEPATVPGADMAVALTGGLSSLMHVGGNGQAMPKELGAFLKDKTLAVAMVGKSALVSTSTKLLAEAVCALKEHTGTLADDPVMGPILSEDAGSTHAIVAGDISALATGLETLFGKAAGPATAFLHMVSAPLTIRVSSTADGAMAKVFLPITADMLKLGLGSVVATETKPKKN
jgi:hypothetical protein